MSDTIRHPLTLRPVVYDLPGTAAVTVRRGIPYDMADVTTATLDIYDPVGATPGGASPAVIFVTGYPDAGLRRVLGCVPKEMAQYVSWARLAAASGLVGITYASREPVADARGVLHFVRTHATALGIDERRIGIWSCSGNVPTALALLMDEDGPRKPGPALACAALCYGYLLDLHGATPVADAQSTFRFANPCAGRSPQHLAPGVPLLVARAGRDEMPGLNGSIDAFVTEALAANLPIALINHADAPHAFDIVHDDDRSRAVVRQVLAFLQAHLL